MALIACPDCGKQVSSRAAACPNCGCPLDDEVLKSVSSNDDKGLKCPRCGSREIVISLEEVASKTRGKAEIRKKSPVTRMANAMGRATMIAATGGLWALTPKKSKYKETKSSSTKNKTRRFGVCQHCGNSWKLGFFD